MKNLLIIVCGTILLGTASCTKTDDSFTLTKSPGNTTEKVSQTTQKVSQPGSASVTKQSVPPEPVLAPPLQINPPTFVVAPIVDFPSIPITPIYPPIITPIAIPQSIPINPETQVGTVPATNK